MQVVSPYRPFPPVSASHQKLGPFDWIDAVRMLRMSVAHSNRCETTVITDVDTTLPVPAWQFHTTERQLMLWILEVSLRFLESDHFDQDTVMVCPDMLIYGDVQTYFDGDWGVMVRPDEKHQRRPIINSVQWWAVAGRDRLVSAYQQLLDVARTLPESLQIWGGDSEPIRRFLLPIDIGLTRRHGVLVHQIDYREVCQGFASTTIWKLQAGRRIQRPTIPILDFRYQRKIWMRQMFDATIGVPA